MSIDTQIRHVTASRANLFRELGFPPDEAERFQAESKQQINDMKVLKEQPAAHAARIARISCAGQR